MGKQSMWKGDIVVSGVIQTAKQYKHFSGHLPEDDGQTLPYFMELFCGHTTSSAADTVRRFLSIGVIPHIEGTLRKNVQTE